MLSVFLWPFDANRKVVLFYFVNGKEDNADEEEDAAVAEVALGLEEGPEVLCFFGIDCDAHDDGEEAIEFGGDVSCTAVGSFACRS